MSSRCLAPKLSTLQRFTGAVTRTSLVASPIRARRSGNWDGACRSTSKRESAAPSSGREAILGISKCRRSNATMKFVLAAYGTRGDVEPSVVAGRELLRRGHDVRIAVPPDHIGFAEAAGLAAVAYGPDSQAVLDKELGTNLFKDFPRHVKDLPRLWRENWELSTQCWSEMSKTLMSEADGADLLFTGLVFEDGAANVAEYYGIPLATLHYFPMRPNSQ